MSAIIAAPRRAARAIVAAPRAVAHETVVSAKFISNDLWTTLVPATAFVVAAARYADLAPGAFAVAVLKALLYFWLYTYGFNLTNQLTGVEEDRINKPFRPLVTGCASIRGATVRAAIVLVAFPLVGWWFGVLLWAVIWEINYLLLNVARWERHWVFKDLAIGIGTVAELAAAWQIVAPLDAVAWRWILTLGLSILVLVPLQDLRDVAGDLVNRRATFPIALGERFTRLFLAAGFAALPFVVHVLLLGGIGTMAAWVADAVLAALSWWIAARVLTRRGPKADHITYRRFEQWYSLVLITAVIVL